jgi:Lrp/AsnC family transcriptional regulator, leucine-responsive regulatory protein
MDQVDLAILRRLQLDARISNRDLASFVGLLEAQCSRRLKGPFERGVIVACVAVVDPAAVDLNLEIILHITLVSSGARETAQFKRAVMVLPFVTEVDRLLGASDYAVKVVAQNLTVFRSLYS